MKLQTKEIKAHINEVTNKKYHNIKRSKKMTLNFPETSGTDIFGEPFTLEGTYEIRVFSMSKNLKEDDPLYYEELWKEYEVLVIGQNDKILLLDPKYLTKGEIPQKTQKAPKPPKGTGKVFTSVNFRTNNGDFTEEEIQNISKELLKGGYYLAKVITEPWQTGDSQETRYCLVYHGVWSGTGKELMWTSPSWTIQEVHQELQEQRFGGRSPITQMEILLGGRSILELQRNIKETYPEAFV